MTKNKFTKCTSKYLVKLFLIDFNLLSINLVFYLLWCPLADCCSVSARYVSKGYGVLPGPYCRVCGGHGGWTFCCRQKNLKSASQKNSPKINWPIAVPALVGWTTTRARGEGTFLVEKQAITHQFHASPYCTPTAQNSKICLTVNYSNNKLIWRPPCCSIVVDDEGEGWGRLFGWKTSNKTSISCITLLYPRHPKNPKSTSRSNTQKINWSGAPPEVVLLSTTRTRS